MWQDKWSPNDSNLSNHHIIPNEDLPQGWQLKWPEWRTLNRIRTGKASTPADQKRWGYIDNDSCSCGGGPCDLNHLITECQGYGPIPSKEDLSVLNENAISWLKLVSDTI